MRRGRRSNRRGPGYTEPRHVGHLQEQHLGQDGGSAVLAMPSLS